MEFSAIILAGGRGSRMGSNKALVPYRGRPLVAYPIELAGLFTRKILISANNHDLDHLGFRVVGDILPAKAPLAGIHAGLTASGTEWNLVLACDMPHLNREVIDRLLEELDGEVNMVVPGHDGYLEPLCGFYHKQMIPEIERNFYAGKFSLLDLPGLVSHKFISFDESGGVANAHIFGNINERKDLRDEQARG